MKEQRIKDFKKIWLAKISDREQAIEVIKDVCLGFYFVAGLSIILGLFVAKVAIIEGIIFAVLSFLLRRFNSRIVAVTLLLLSLWVFVVTFINKIGAGTGGRNIFLAVTMVWAGIRAIQATFTLPKLNKTINQA